MSLPLLQYGLERGRALRDVGIAKVAGHPTSQKWIHHARSLAIQHALDNWTGTVSANDIWRYIGEGILDEPPHPNAFGALFKSKEFVFTGTYIASTRAERHAGMVRLWRLK